MRIQNVKAMVTKVVTLGLLAGAFAMAAPVKAQAQEYGVRVQFGNPYYRNHYDHIRVEEYRRHDDWAYSHPYSTHPYGGYRHGGAYRYR